jgi:hypothetical protein
MKGHATKYENVKTHTWKSFLNNNPKQKQRLRNVMFNEKER